MESSWKSREISVVSEQSCGPLMGCHELEDWEDAKYNAPLRHSGIDALYTPVGNRACVLPRSILGARVRVSKRKQPPRDATGVSQLRR